ncbi:fructose 1,6-bisphosphatase [Candidatus Gottesmanbacteria bacterium]|nr:fructose 1,6-bisphosphatase [Candidatus Gottesmanbacteria bacterium]
MKITLSVIKADIGSIGGHVKPSEKVIKTVSNYIQETGKNIILDSGVFHTGDDIAILMSHQKGKLAEPVHKLAWDAFLEGTRVAKEQGLYGAGQDLLKDSFSGNVKGMGPAVAELEFEERKAEPFILFMADKTEPGAFNLPFYLAFADPMYCPGLMIAPTMKNGFRFNIMDVSYTEGDRIIELQAPKDLYDIAALLRDIEKYVIEGIYNQDSEQAVAVSTTRLHNIAGKYTGKDDPVALVRSQSQFPATGEVLSPFAICPYVGGFMRGSHNGPLMPVKMGSAVSYFDGPPIVSAVGFCVHEGKFSEPVDLFDHPAWERIGQKAADKALTIREQGFFGVAMLGLGELEYTGIMERLKELDKKFVLRR